MNSDSATSLGGTKSASHGSSSGRESVAALKDQAQVIGHDVRELGTLAKDAVAEGYAHTKETGSEMIANVRHKADKYEDSLIHAMRESPVRTLLYAAGAGLVLGFILRR